MLGGDDGRTLLMCAAPDFAEANRVARRTRPCCSPPRSTSRTPGCHEPPFGLLGPAAAWRDGGELELGSPQQRALFALLLLHRNEVVSTDRMIDALWPAGPPPNARAGPAHLRLPFARRAARRRVPLVTCHQGYELRVADAPSTPIASRRWWPRAAPQFEARRRGRRRGAALEALALVRGPPLAGAVRRSLAAAERARLAELARPPRRSSSEARLAQGRHRELVPELRAAVAADPLRERAWGQLMVALYRSGRQAEALDAYRDAHARSPTAGARARARSYATLERMILLQDAALDLPRRARRAAALRTSFVGRERELAALARACASGGSCRSSARPARARPGSRPSSRAGAGSGRMCGGSISARSGRVGSWRRSRARSRRREVPGRATVDLIAARLR